MTAETKLEVLRAVQGAGLPVKQVLSELGIARSTYYRWRWSFRHRGQPGLHDRSPTHGRTWNQILPEERDKVLQIALLFPDWSPRQVSCHITDTAGFSVSESSVYRILKGKGLIHEAQQKTFPAGSEYRVKTTEINPNSDIEPLKR
jgi:putative transposase